VVVVGPAYLTLKPLITPPRRPDRTRALRAASLSARAAWAVVDNHVGPSRPTPSNDVRRQSKMYQIGLAPPGNAPDQKGLRREFQVIGMQESKASHEGGR
jgi:hypothetical protein